MMTIIKLVYECRYPTQTLVHLQASNDFRQLLFYPKPSLATPTDHTFCTLVLEPEESTQVNELHCTCQ